MPEIWLKGPVTEVPKLLQPVAHALLQSNEEINEMMKGFDASTLWKSVADIASVGFHLQHIAGIQDRLLTYARSELLNEQQLQYLKNEGIDDETININSLLKNLNHQTKKSIEQLKHTDENNLTAARYVGRKQLPSTVIGLLFHAAEHTMRHTGQLLVTVKILQAYKT